MDDDRNMPEDNDIGPFEYENYENEPEHPKAWVTDRESERMPVLYTEHEVGLLLNQLFWDLRAIMPNRKDVSGSWWYNWWEKNKKK